MINPSRPKLVTGACSHQTTASPHSLISSHRCVEDAYTLVHGAPRTVVPEYVVPTGAHV